MACHYSGRLNKGRRQGQGRYDYGCGFVYTGDWHEGMKHGQGRLDLPHGAIYEGSFVQGEIQGKVSKVHGMLCLEERGAPGDRVTCTHSLTSSVLWLCVCK